jgi:uncharacterized protein
VTQSRSTVSTLVGILIFSVATGTMYTPRRSCGLHLNVDVQLPSGSAINAEVSTSSSALERGLMGRTSLPPGNGMLFVYPNVGRHRHWMYGCLIPLDIVWLSDDKHIVEIVPSAQPCTTGPCPSYGQNYSSRFVLEIAAGEAARLGLRIGDQLRFWTSELVSDSGGLQSVHAAAEALPFGRERLPIAQSVSTLSQTHRRLIRR